MRRRIDHLTAKEATEFIYPRHYSGRKPQISEAFGWIFDEKLKAAVTFGKPASPALCNGVCGPDYSSNVYELNRLIRDDDLTEPLSQFVGACLRRISFNNWIIVSYADAGVNHNGYIYQALNFIYTGKTKERLQFHVPNGHSRHGSKDSPYREVRTPKHRYIYFATKNKNLKKAWMQALNYEIQPYPKEQNINYELGTYYSPKIVNINEK